MAARPTRTGRRSSMAAEMRPDAGPDVPMKALSDCGRGSTASNNKKYANAGSEFKHSRNADTDLNDVALRTFQYSKKYSRSSAAHNATAAVQPSRTNGDSRHLEPRYLRKDVRSSTHDDGAPATTLPSTSGALYSW